MADGICSAASCPTFKEQGAAAVKSDVPFRGLFRVAQQAEKSFEFVPEQFCPITFPVFADLIKPWVIANITFYNL